MNEASLREFGARLDAAAAAAAGSGSKVELRSAVKAGEYEPMAATVNGLSSCPHHVSKDCERSMDTCGAQCLRARTDMQFLYHWLCQAVGTAMQGYSWQLPAWQHVSAVLTCCRQQIMQP